MARYKEETERFWQSHVDTFNQLDVTKVDYAKANNLNRGRWMYWSCKLMRLESGFVPVKVKSSLVKSDTALVVIDAPSGIRLSIYDWSVLSQLPLLLSSLSK